MENIFLKEIREFFPYSPYKVKDGKNAGKNIKHKMQVDFMLILYNILKYSNIKKENGIDIFYSFVKENGYIKKKLENDGNESYLDLLNRDIKVENEIKEVEKYGNYEHIICEMKTGSGKTLTLLSSVVYWLFKHRFDLFLINENVELSSTEPKWVKERIVEKVICKYLTLIKTENERRRRDEEVLDHYFQISDEKIVLKENVSIRKREVKVEKKEFDGSTTIMEEKDEDSLSDVSLEEKGKKQIFICSRTQSQLNQYFDELKKIEKKIQNKFSINMIIIGSRKHLCINEEFLRKYKGTNELNDSCKSSQCKYKNAFYDKMTEFVMKKKKRKKIFFESSESDTSTNDSSGRNKDIEKDKDKDKVDNYTLVTTLLNRKNVNMNEIKEICKDEKIEICPYYLNRENIKQADIVLLPYICILNEDIRKNLKINIKNNILIFDESQNIIDNINDCNSNSLFYFQIYFCKLILNEYINKYKSILNNSNIVMIKQIIIYCNLLIHMFNMDVEKPSDNSSANKERDFNQNRNEYFTEKKSFMLDSIKNKSYINESLNVNTNVNESLNADTNVNTNKNSEKILDTKLNVSKDRELKKNEKEKKENCTQKILNVNKFNILSKIDAVNLNNLSFFLSSSLFCKRIRIFAEVFINKNFKDFRKHSEFNTSSITTSIYSLNTFTTALINTNKYDYVFINDGTEGKTGNSEDEKCKNPSESDGKKREKKELTNMLGKTNDDNNNNDNDKVTVKVKMNIPHTTHRKRIQTNTCTEEQEMKRKKNYMEKKKTEKDANMLLFKKLFTNILNKQKEMFKKIEIVSVSSCNNFQKIVKDCKNIILIGGTLYPLEEFLLLFLNEEKNKIKVFFSDYIFKKENIFCRIINRSIISNELIDNTFKNRFNKLHLLNLVIQIFILTLNVCYGNIIFFPSYTFLKTFINFLNNEGNYVLGKMMKQKNVFFEKKSDNSVLKDYIQSIKNIKEQDVSRRIKNGSVLFCVMNAKLSEGINFHDEYCRNIIIVGIPFFKYENKNSNIFVLDKNSLVLEYYKKYSTEVTSGEKSSSAVLGVEDVNRMCKTYQVKSAMKIVNQCVGRSLRHFDDFSSFFFLDFRFSKNDVYENFPSFIRKHIDSISNTSVATDNNTLFLKTHKNFIDIYNDFKNYYSTNYSHLKFENTDKTYLNMFVEDLHSLTQFHQRMNNF